MAVVPANEKSAGSRVAGSISSSKVTRHTKLSALVGLVAGVWRTIDVTRGSVLSSVTFGVGVCGKPGVLISVSAEVFTKVMLVTLIAPSCPAGTA